MLKGTLRRFAALFIAVMMVLSSVGIEGLADELVSESFHVTVSEPAKEEPAKDPEPAKAT